MPDTNESPPVRPDLAFDVVSIHPSKAGPNEWRMQILPWGDEYRAIGLPLARTLLFAYLPWHSFSRDRIVGAPGWLWDDEFDFVGKVGESDLPAWHSFVSRGFHVPNPMLQTMLRNALIERCKLAIHLVPAEADGFALVVAAHGPNVKKLVKAKADDVIPDNAMMITFGGRMVPIASPDNPVLHFYATSMAALAESLSGGGAIVVDRTGLAGKYRFDLTRLGSEGVPASDWDVARLGLKLIPAKIPTENIVIDHIERPTPD